MLVNLTNKEIEQKGGILLRTETEFDDHYGSWITFNVYLSNGKEVSSSTDWDFQNP